MKVILPVTVLGIVMIIAGCNRPASTETPAAAPAVKILGYINVSSGCQQATVDFLGGLPAKYPGVEVELVDFGDGGPGARRWEESGLKCMAVLIDGESIVRYPVGQEMRMTAFRSPAGLAWTHEDFEQALQAALAGKLEPVSEEEFMASHGQMPSPEQLQDYKSKQAAPEKQ